MAASGARWMAMLVAGLAAAAASGAPSVLEPPPAAASVEQLTLSSGLRVLLGSPARPASFTEALLVVPAGTRRQKAGDEESAPLAAAAFLAGRLAADEPPVRRHLARMGATLDYTVGPEVAVFRFAAPSRNATSLLRSIGRLLRRDSPGAAVWEEAMATHRGAVAAREADPWLRALETLDGLLWRAAGGGEDGSGEPVPALDLARVEAFRAAAYRADRMVIALWGDLPAAKLGELARQELGVEPGPAGGVALPEREEPRLRPAGGIRCLIEPGAEPPALLVGLGAEMPDDLSFYGWQLAAHLLGSSHSSRLHQRLRVREPFVYTVEAVCQPVGRRGITLRISAQTEDLERAREVVMEELQRLVSEEVAQPELDLARAIFRSRLLLDRGSFRDQLYRRALTLVSSSPPRDLTQGEAALAALTPASLLGILRRTLKPENAAAVIVSARPEPLFCERAR